MYISDEFLKDEGCTYILVAHYKDNYDHILLIWNPI